MPRRTALLAGMVLPTLVMAAWPAAADWPGYHGGPGRSGYDLASVDLRPATTSWSAAGLDGQLYGSPVMSGGTLFVATEQGTVYAVDEATGAPRWNRHVAAPVPASAFPCGNILNVGVTGTPVVDPARGEVFVVAAVAAPGGIQHRLYGLDTTTGAVRLDTSADAPGADPTTHLQRGALALSAGRVLVPYGGNSGDCGQYQGRVLGIPEDGSAGTVAYTSRSTRRAGMWAPGGPQVARDGTIWVANGNGASTTAFDTSNSVIKLSPDLQQLGSFTPSTWVQDNQQDQDLGSTSPLLLPGGYVFQVGKRGTAYLLSMAKPGGIGGERFQAPVCASFGSQAYADGTIYVSCTDGMRALSYDPLRGSFAPKWHATGAANGAPTIAGGLVWSVNASQGTLLGLDPATGRTVLTRPLGRGDAHFVTPAADGGRLFVAFGTTVTAFSGTAVPQTEIEGKYQALGGPTGFLGQSYGPEHRVTGGAGQDYDSGSIFWSAQTGAHVVYGAILGRYIALGGPGGIAGLPLTDETGTPDGLGRYNHFTNGASIYWTPPTGAHVVYGAIRQEWQATGWEAGPAGYPTSDETGTPDGTGRYNTFSAGAAVYWTPQTGAHLVHGAIWAYWSGHGAERSAQGYPVSDEKAAPGGRVSSFQHGSLFWDATSGVVTPTP